MINLNDHIQIKEELLEEYTKKVKSDMINEILVKAQKTLDERGRFYYIDFLSIMREMSVENEG